MTIAVIFTSKTKDMLVQQGGTSWWVASERTLKHVTHVLLCHNAHDARRPGDHARHGTAFLIGKYAGYDGGDTRADGRKLLRFNEIADLNVPGYWDGLRNPVHYAAERDVEARLAAAGQSMETLDWVTLEAARVALAEKDSVHPDMDTEADPGLQTEAGMVVEQVLADARNDIADALGLPLNHVRVNVTIDPFGSAY